MKPLKPEVLPACIRPCYSYGAPIAVVVTVLGCLGWFVVDTHRIEKRNDQVRATRAVERAQDMLEENMVRERLAASSVIPKALDTAPITVTGPANKAVFSGDVEIHGALYVNGVLITGSSEPGREVLEK